MHVIPQRVCGFVSNEHMPWDGDRATAHSVSEGLVYAAKFLPGEFYQQKTSPNLELHTVQSILANIRVYRKTFWQQNLIYVS